MDPPVANDESVAPDASPDCVAESVAYGAAPEYARYAANWVEAADVHDPDATMSSRSVENKMINMIEITNINPNYR